jgi:hypothetical protein
MPTCVDQGTGTMHDIVQDYYGKTLQGTADLKTMACEDFGQAVVYPGSIPEQPHRFLLAKYHDIEQFLPPLRAVRGLRRLAALRHGFGRDDGLRRVLLTSGSGFSLTMFG